jgi:excisionase family DNA binding protein
VVVTEERFYTVKQIAERLQVQPKTVSGWLRDGKLKGLRLSGPAGWRVRQSDLDRYLREIEESGD